VDTKKSNRKIVILNQAANYLTVGLCNSFYESFEDVTLITGGIHIQGEEINPDIKVVYINRWVDFPAKKKMISYLIATWKMFWLLKTKYRKHEVLFVSLPPMAYLLNLFVRNRFSMIIWDVYPDVFKIAGMAEHNLLYKIWSYLNVLSFKKAYKLFTIGNVISDLISNYIEKDRIIILPIWSIFQHAPNIDKSQNPFVVDNELNGKFVVQYSGNIGVTHKVETVVQLAHLLKENDRIVFQIIGRGPRVNHLKKLVVESNLSNCKFLPFQSDEMFPYSLAAADLGIVILDEKASKGSVPSKSYNLMSYGIPSVYIASPDSELYIYAEKFHHAKCFSENELNKAKDFIIEMTDNKMLYKQLSDNCLKAAEQFTRANANKFVEKYLIE
jgi:hypothetical protein